MKYHNETQEHLEMLDLSPEELNIMMIMVKELVAHDKTILCIKIIRDALGCTLLTAKTLAFELRDNYMSNWR